MIKQKEHIRVRPYTLTLVNILIDIQQGRVKIPLFQRDFIWEQKQMLDLFDSIEKGYPIGSIIFWKPEEKYKCFEDFGPYKLPQEAMDLKYVLDGYQRLSTLFGVLSNPQNHIKTSDEDLKKYSIYYDLKNEEFTYQIKSNMSIYYIPLYVLIDTFDFLDFSEKLRAKVNNKSESNELISRARQLAKKLVEYELSFIEIQGGDIKSSVDIFSRVNTKGTKMSTDWMLSALSYVPEQFLLTEKISEFLIDLEEYNFHTLNRSTILNCIQAATDKPYFDVKIENLARRQDFPDLVVQTFENIKKAIQFLNRELNIVEYKLLPYNTQLIFFSEFFRLNAKFTEYHKEELIRWFWKTSYANYFTIYSSLSRQRKAVKLFNDFAKGTKKNSLYIQDRRQKFVTNPFPEKMNFKSVRYKAFLLFLLKNAYINEPSLIKTKYEFYLSFLIPKERTPSNIVTTLRNEVASPLLPSLDKSSNNHFINCYIIDMLEKERYLDALKERTLFIQNEEQSFVESLELIYTLESNSKEKK